MNTLPPESSKLRLNTLGFLPEAEKRATLATANPSEFQVVHSSDESVVFKGSSSGPISTAVTETDERVVIADFTELKQPGTYRLVVPGLGSSPVFRIAPDLWNEPCRLAARGFYLWRCGTAVHAEHRGHVFAHGPCHLEDGWLDEVGQPGKRRPGTGGWHDAGDYNKYTVNAAATLAFLFKSWEHFKSGVTNLSLQLPESGRGTPDLLCEIRWELTWLFCMQADDGRVYHKLSARDFKYWGPPELDQTPRYYSPWSSAATADFVAVYAAAARHFRAFDASFADRCLTAALKSAEFLAAHPENVRADLHAFGTGDYQADDYMHRLWALAEWWETTGDLTALHDFEQRAARRTFNFEGPNWSNPADFALLSYLLGFQKPSEREPILVERLSASLLAQAERIVQTAESNAYGRPLGGERASWSWGGNGTVAAQTLLLHSADRLKPDPRYRRAANGALDFLFGRNFDGRSYVTGLGANPPLHPHDRRGEPAWPGYLVGGGWPDGRSWRDDEKNYRLNEIAINWNGALVYALAAFATRS